MAIGIKEIVRSTDFGAGVVLLWSRPGELSIIESIECNVVVREADDSKF